MIEKPMDGGHAAAAATAQAIKVSGTIVKLNQQFLAVLNRQPKPLVVFLRGGLFQEKYQYLTSYKGLAFFTKSSTDLPLPFASEVVVAGSIWVLPASPPEPRRNRPTTY
jgi:hypothetical protein